jgi:hypothetical protein
VQRKFGFIDYQDIRALSLVVEGQMGEDHHYLSFRGPVRQSIPAHCRDQKPQQDACCVEGTRRGATQEERDHGDSESRLAVNQSGNLDGDGGSGWFGVCLPIKAAGLHGVRRVWILESRQDGIQGSANGRFSSVWSARRKTLNDKARTKTPFSSIVG